MYAEKYTYIGCRELLLSRANGRTKDDFYFIENLKNH